MEAADGLVADLGVSGRHPEVAAAAARVAEGYAAAAAERFDRSLADFEAAVRRVASAGGAAGTPGPRGDE